MASPPRPKKKFGQNFLSDPVILGRIVEVAQVSTSDRVLEVGPGRGALTRRLAAAAGQVVAVEIDQELVPLLQEEFGAASGVAIVAGDILRLDLLTVLEQYGPSPWKVVANLPYYISTEVLFLFLRHRQHFSRLVVMLQREVGERLAAVPGSKAYGALSILCQHHFEVRGEFIVRPGAFHPPPKVDSVVVSFTPRPAPLADVGNEETFRRTVKAAFSQRRKTLFNSLKGGLALESAELQAVLERAGIDGLRRAETLTLSEFAALSRAFSLQSTGKAVANP